MPWEDSSFILRTRVVMPRGGKLTYIGDIENAVYPETLFSYQKELYAGEQAEANPYWRLIDYLYQFKNDPNYPSEGIAVLKNIEIPYSRD